MSQPIAPRPVDGVTDPTHSPSPATLLKARKISTACGACKQRKTRCSGGSTCDACAARSSPCIYDASSDQRRKIANQRNVHDLAEAHHDLERLRQLTGGIIAIFRAGHVEATNDLIRLIRSGIDLSQLAAYVRNEVRASFHIENAFQDVDFHIDGPSELPSPSTLLARLEQQQSQTNSESGSTSAYNTDPSMSR